MPFIVSNALFDYWWTPDAACAALLRATAVTCSRAVGRAFCGGSNRERTRYGEDFRPPQPVCRRSGKGSRLGRRKKAGTFDPEKFEDHYESALLELINEKRAGKVIRPKERPKGENVVDLMDALRKSVGDAAASQKKPAKKSKKASAGQTEMLMPISGKKAAKQASGKKPAARAQRKSA